MRVRLALHVLLAVAATAAANPVAVPPSVRRALAATSVALAPIGCSGVLAESRQLVLTARHCVRDVGESLRVRFHGGVARTAWVVTVDEIADQAVLLLDEPVPIEPLEVLRRAPIPGMVLYFEGHPDRPRLQSARLDRLGECPSLPRLPNALFTSIHGEPGDSGAPLVDGAGRVVGLVHGGTRCRIATPADHLARLIDRILAREPLRAMGEDVRNKQG